MQKQTGYARLGLKLENYPVFVGLTINSTLNYFIVVLTRVKLESGASHILNGLVSR